MNSPTLGCHSKSSHTTNIIVIGNSQHINAQLYSSIYGRLGMAGSASGGWLTAKRLAVVMWIYLKCAFVESGSAVERKGFFDWVSLGGHVPASVLG